MSSSYTAPLTPPEVWASLMVAIARRTDLAPILADVLAEVARAESLHGPMPDDVIHAAAVVAEESSELIQAALQFRYESGDLADVRKEALHTAATALRLIAGLRNVKQEARP